jgi:hypothetical protein
VNRAPVRVGHARHHELGVGHADGLAEGVGDAARDHLGVLARAVAAAAGPKRDSLRYLNSKKLSVSTIFFANRTLL